MPHWAYHHSTEIAARCWALLAEHAQVITAPGQATLVSFAAKGDASEEAARLRELGVMVRDMPGTDGYAPRAAGGRPTATSSV